MRSTIRVIVRRRQGRGEDGRTGEVVRPPRRGGGRTRSSVLLDLSCKGRLRRDRGEACAECGGKRGAPAPQQGGREEQQTNVQPPQQRGGGNDDGDCLRAVDGRQFRSERRMPAPHSELETTRQPLVE